VHLPKALWGTSGNVRHGENMEMGKWAHGKSSFIAVTCMASTVSTQKHNILWENRSFIGQGGEARG
jgi:hypothetical protein